MKTLLRLFILLLASAPAVPAQIPQQINYQGRVVVRGVNFTGNGQFKFALVDAGANQNRTATASGFATLRVSTISLESGGSGYLEPPAVTISPPDQPGGVQATAVASIAGGVVTAIDVTEAGSGYSNHPQVTIAPPPPDMVHSTYWSNGGDLDPGEVPDAAVTVPVSNGLYSVRLADPALGMAPFHADTFQSVPLFLRVWFSDGVNGFQQLTPDQPLGTAPYAFTSQLALTVPNQSIGRFQLADGSVTSAKLADAAVGGAQLGPGAVAASLANSGLAAVAAGGIVLSATANPALAAAGYTRIGSARLGDYWRTANPGTARAARSSHSMVWTGTEWIIWGGTASNPNTGGNVPLGDGFRYNPAAASWAKISGLGAPSARVKHSAVWTGSEMLIWGGGDIAGTLQDGALYNPLTDQWRPMSPMGAPAGRVGHASVWTGSELIVWGGVKGSALGDGARYHPTTNSWTALSPLGAPSSRSDMAFAWTGTEMIVWGGRNFITNYADGARYNPISNLWLPLSAAGAPSARQYAKATWTGSEMVIWGGAVFGVSLGDGARYRPATDDWLPVSATGAPAPRHLHTATWTGTEIVIWGGQQDSTALGSGAKYDPASNSWSAVSASGSPTARIGHTALWTGDRMAVFGGYGTAALNDAAEYQPTANTWSTPSRAALPSPRMGASMDWTGREVLIWGGIPDSNAPASLGDGAGYSPSTDSWRAITTVNAPVPRYGHASCWTGSELIIWGGLSKVSSAVTYLNTGARYSPATDSWTGMSTAGAPSAVPAGINRLHQSVWTGSQFIVMTGNLVGNARYIPATNQWLPVSMAGGPPEDYMVDYSLAWTGRQLIFWGGRGSIGFGPALNTGYAYDPDTNTWAAISPVGAPSARASHTAVWTGTEMIIRGGINFDSVITGGGRYNPATNSWLPVTSANAFGGLDDRAIWTGQEMIVFGGISPGGRYDPATDSWSALSGDAAPSLPRYLPLLAWTGTEMLVCAGDTNYFIPAPPGLWGFTPGRSMQLYMKP